ncbi:MAG: spore photoproduct lyase family protein [bacterium]
MPFYLPEKIIIDPKVRSSALTENIIRNAPSIPVEYRRVDKDSLNHLTCKDLVIAHYQGNFYKPCPGTLHYLCCQYKILNIGLNCPLACTYCILQSYLDHPAMVVHANVEEMLQELDALFSQYPTTIFRIGTGEFTDSLVLDPLSELTKVIVPSFANQKNAFLELKTKTTNVHNLQGLEHRGKTIVAWSLNSPRVVREEEPGAPSIEERLLAAQKCQGWGYRLAFHFDPVIFYPGWEEDYQKTIELLFTMIKPSAITWISLGCFRYMPKLKAAIQEKFHRSRIIYEEFIQGLDGKMRYLEVLRQEIYAKMAYWIRQKAPHCFLYLCMESPKVWRNSLGCAPFDNREFQAWLDQRCQGQVTR